MSELHGTQESQEASVCALCVTYNHEKFIRKTLDGFVAQKTTYPFRVIVHDDASTDSTPEIMREYEAKYPDLFTMIYETENQFSRIKNIGKIYSEILAPLVHEKYVALCEGDDYWCDPEKVQLQTDFMENNPDFSMCVHDTMFVNFDGQDVRRLNGSDQDQNYGMKEVLLDWGRGFHTTSFFCKRETAFERPTEFYVTCIDDWALSLYAATLGKMHYIGRVMSCFRKGNPNSLTGKPDTRKPYEHEDDGKDIIEFLRNINEYTNRKYDTYFRMRIRSIESLGLLRQHKFVKALVKYPYYSAKHLAGDLLRKFNMMY